ncbi:hypothetical protein C8R44DRAFT_740417 [Mycena epipterygia]|nr:hypothetical protein C8R44DRAFT_740417 [Mycena epipterygia]
MQLLSSLLPRAAVFALLLLGLLCLLLTIPACPQLTPATCFPPAVYAHRPPAACFPPALRVHAAPYPPLRQLALAVPRNALLLRLRSLPANSQGISYTYGLRIPTVKHRSRTPAQPPTTEALLTTKDGTS